jgi:uncharacterized protein involved in response to NO
MLVQLEQPAPAETSLPLLRAGFRPFFLLAGLQAALQVPLWLAQIAGGASLQLPYSAALWHGHEMLFGFGGAAVAGFLLTAVPSWTGVPTPKGAPLGLFVLLFVAARVAFALGGLLPPWVAAALDLPFLPILAAMVAVPLFKAGNRRNYQFLPILGVLTIADALVLAEMCGLGNLGRNGLYLGLFLLILMIGIVGGRIIPTFTQSGLRMAGVTWQAKPAPNFDRVAIGLLAAVAVAEAVAPASLWAGILCLAAAPVHLVRLARWEGWRGRKLPLLWVLHIGYLWLPLGLALVGVATVAAGPLRPEAALHGLTTGCIGTMVLAVMSRAALGHGGRPLVAAPPTVVAYLLVWGAAWLRVFGPMVDPTKTLWFSGLVWTAGFALFVFVYAPICLNPRADGQPG